MSKGYDVPTSIAVDDTVRYLNKGWGTVTGLWEDKKNWKN